ncbi:Ankyrin repeat domain-containing protein 27 [Cytospora mali]|uniref:Ankyrin repeat domain-containing protein 27 n=1 Tax=Cytospora mali TaxID=578113 RepID=A0A194V5U6_CYTMA|nr:Ankyrin repeat domain-containing protein 27 [Valsa mali var. pyri (nom. inval.)]
MNIERRREQNREAQRRFRDTAVASVPPACFSASQTNPTPVDTPKTCSSFSFYGTNLLLDNIELVDMDNDRIADSVKDAVSSTIQGKQLADMVKELANENDTSLDRIRIRNHVRHPTDKNPSTFQQPHQNDWDSSVRSRVEGTKEPEMSGWMTPLHVAAQRGRDGIVRTLLQHNADCNSKDSDNLTPLARAVMGGHNEVVALLLSHGARISEVDDQGRTALHWAIMRQHGGVLKLLLEHCGRGNAVIDSHDMTGRSPVYIAIETDFEEGLQLLLEFGADIHSRLRKNTPE